MDIPVLLCVLLSPIGKIVGLIYLCLCVLEGQYKTPVGQIDFLFRRH